MNLRYTFALLAACGFALSMTGCHHLQYNDRVWNGTCNDVSYAGGCTQKGSCQKSVCQKGGGCGSSAHAPLFSKLSHYFWCADGCGEIYVGEWVSDPPDCCDPCDDYFGCYTGPNDCCCQKCYDPWLWILKLKHKHCAPAWHEHGIPTSGCHFLDCTCCYGCYPTVCGGCGKGGCGKGCGKCGGVVGDYIPYEEGFYEQDGELSPHQVDELPMPVIGDNSRNRVANHYERAALRR
jgi:hypothetical protein